MEREINKEKRNNYIVLDALKMFFYVLVINLLVSVAYTVFMFVISIFYSGTYRELLGTPFAFYVGIIIIPIAFMLCFWSYNKVNGVNPKTAVAPSKKFNWLSLVIVVALCGLLVVGFMPIISMILNVFDSIGLNASGGQIYSMDTPLRVVLGLFAYSLLPAFAEELLFRGVIFKGLSRKAKPVTAIMLSALMFCLMHGGIQQTLYQFLLGVALGYIMYHTGNIIFPMIFHFLNNLVVVILELTGGFNSFLGGFEQNVGGYFLALAIAVVATAVIVLLFWLLRKINKTEESDAIVVEGDNIIIDDKDKKMEGKTFVSSFDINEKFYFYSGMIIAIIIWISNSF